MKEEQANKKNGLAYRQIHLDFHTSEQIATVGNNFDGEQFARTLSDAKVNSITCFARCHHGMLYYDSKCFPERIHPGLTNKNLLKEQIQACHKYGIRVPIYITVQWDYYSAMRHPEWLCMKEDGSVSGWKPYQAGFYADLCVNTGYLDFLKQHTAEVLENMDVDGLFFDIVRPVECSCATCRKEMIKMGLEPSDKDQRLQFATFSINRFKHEMTAFVRQYNKDCSIFYNSGHVDHTIHNSLDAYTHLELESLPGGGWGYIHFPITMRYARNLGKDCIGMTGKFHTTWGDFHSFKNPAALQFEVFQMIALNGGCSIGDQLEPDGKLSPPVYDLIGKVYRSVAEKEPWCVRAKALTEIGVFVNEGHIGRGQGGIDAPSVGVAKMLQEGSYQFDFIDSSSDLSGYKLIILPDLITLNEKMKKELLQYQKQGGKILASYRSGLDKDKFAPDFGVSVNPEQTVNVVTKEEVSGKAYPNNAYADYILPEGVMAKGLDSVYHVMYMKGLQVKATTGTVLSKTYKSYFDRDYRHFCSHNQTPSSGEYAYDAVVQTENTIYYAHPVFSIYAKKAPVWCKKLVFNGIDLLLGQKLVAHNGSSTVVTAINEQEEENRAVLHVLHYIPERRCSDIDIIEDVIPLYNLKMQIKIRKDVKGVALVPEKENIDYTYDGETLEFTIPCVSGHSMVEIQY